MFKSYTDLFFLCNCNGIFLSFQFVVKFKRDCTIFIYVFINLLMSSVYTSDMKMNFKGIWRKVDGSVLIYISSSNIFQLCFLLKDFINVVWLPLFAVGIDGLPTESHENIAPQLTLPGNQLQLFKHVVSKILGYFNDTPVVKYNLKMSIYWRSVQMH